MKLWIDTDAGVDDATAILIALKCPDVEIVGISCVQGNAGLASVVTNVNKTLRVFGHDSEKVPVYAGCKHAIVQEHMEIAEIHGKDGMGDVNPASYGLDPSYPATPGYGPVKLLEALHKDPLTLLCLGPLTNIAVAMRIDPEAFENVERLVIMGGAIGGDGNTTKWAEFNFKADPHAAHIIMNEFPQSKTVLSTWTLTAKHRLNQVEVAAVLGLHETVLQNFLREIWRPCIAFCKGEGYMADPLASFICCYPDVAITKAERMHLTICYTGEKEGQSTGEPNPSGVLVVEEVDKELFKQKLFEIMADH